MEITELDFEIGKLNISPCYIRANVIATINKDNIIRHVAVLKQAKIDEVLDRITMVVRQDFE